jgi:hypothetical protein
MLFIKLKTIYYSLLTHLSLAIIEAGAGTGQQSGWPRLYTLFEPERPAKQNEL